MQRKEVWEETALYQFRTEAQIWNSYSSELLHSMFTDSQVAEDFNFFGMSVFRVNATMPQEWKEEKDTLRTHITRPQSINKRLSLMEMELPVVRQPQ